MPFANHFTSVIRHTSQMNLGKISKKWARDLIEGWKIRWIVWYHVDFKLHISQFTLVLINLLLIFSHLTKLQTNRNEFKPWKSFSQGYQEIFLYQSRKISQHLWRSSERRILLHWRCMFHPASSSLKQINKNKSSPTHPLLLIGREQWLTDDAGKLQQRGHWTNTHWHQQCTSLNGEVWTRVAPRAMFGQWELGRPVERMKLVDWREFWDIAWVTLGKGGRVGSGDVDMFLKSRWWWPRDLHRAQGGPGWDLRLKPPWIPCLIDGESRKGEEL